MKTVTMEELWKKFDSQTFSKVWLSS